MTNWHRTPLLRLLQLADLAVVAAAFLSAVALAAPGDDDWLTILEMRVQVRNVLFVAGYLAYCHFVFHGFRLYRSYRLSPSSREWYDLAWAVLTATVSLWALADPFRFQFATRTFLPLFAGLAFCGLGAERRLLRVLARSMRRHGRDLRTVIVVGDGEEAFDTIAHLARRADLGYRLLDLGVSLVAGLLLLPFCVTLATAVKLDSPGPIVFAQERVGLRRRRFRIYKFRTMLGGADGLPAGPEPLDEAQGPVVKV